MVTYLFVDILALIESIIGYITGFICLYWLIRYNKYKTTERIQSYQDRHSISIDIAALIALFITATFLLSRYIEPNKTDPPTLLYNQIEIILQFMNGIGYVCVCI